ncbi:PsaA [Schleiferilactobacillus shenzhenensis LY-73]|uniref:PsaA n=2 Tax=Schleiferilactobacillus shenzhenensis TaxID=1231337 RepID=U4TSY9_9LACO|nr:PsaA [Schleiferilactobacillus shenzhenensis LY-73]
MRRVALTLLGLLAISALTVWVIQRPAQADQGAGDKLSLVATNSILADMTAQVLGDRGTVRSIVPRGQDPHEYEARPEDVAAVADADLIIANGFNLEAGWLTKLRRTAKRDAASVITATAAVPVYPLANGEPDPHAWLDLSNGIRYVATIRDALIEKDPAHAAGYRTRAAAYTQRLAALDNEAKTTMATIPADRRILVTTEGAFRYFARAYGLETLSVWQINSEQQATPTQMRTVMDAVRKRRPPVLFRESSLPAKTMEQVSQETDTPIAAVLYTDSLAKKGVAGDTYYDMVKWNLDQVVAGLK